MTDYRTAYPREDDMEEDIKKIKKANMEASIEQKWKNLGLWVVRILVFVALVFLGLGVYGILKSCNEPPGPKEPKVVTQCMIRSSQRTFYLQQQNVNGKEITELEVESIDKGIELAKKMECPLVNKIKNEATSSSGDSNVE